MEKKFSKCLEAFTLMKNMFGVENEVTKEKNSGDEGIGDEGDGHEDGNINGKKNGRKKRKSDGVSWLNFIYRIKKK
jgi:hypothetical protein